MAEKKISLFGVATPMRDGINDKDGIMKKSTP